MRRLYMSPFNVWDQHRDYFHPQIGSHYLHLISYASQANAELLNNDPASWAKLPEVVAWTAIGSPLLISTSVDYSESAQDLWESHPDVAILPHPVFEGTDPLSKHLNSKTKKLQQKHLDALAIIGVKPSDTVLDVSAKSSAIMPQCKVRAIL